MEKIITKAQKVNGKKASKQQQAKSGAKGRSPSDMQQAARTAANKARKIERDRIAKAKATAKKLAREDKRRAKMREKAKRVLDEAAREQETRERMIAEANQHGARLAALPTDEAMDMVAKWRAHRDAKALVNKAKYEGRA